MVGAAVGAGCWGEAGAWAAWLGVAVGVAAGVGEASASIVPGAEVAGSGADETDGEEASASARVPGPPIASLVNANVMTAATATVATTAMATIRESRVERSMSGSVV